MLCWFMSLDLPGTGISVAGGILDKLLYHTSADNHRLLGSSRHVFLRAVRSRPRLWTQLVLCIPTAQRHHWHCVSRLPDGSLLPMETQSSQPSQEYRQHRQRRSVLSSTSVTAASQSSSASWIRSWHWMVHLPSYRVCPFHLHCTTDSRTFNIQHLILFNHHQVSLINKLTHANVPDMAIPALLLLLLLLL